MELTTLLSVLLALNGPLSARLLQLPLGADCQDGWVCTTPDKCTSLGDIKISRPEICSFISEKEPILCCPPETLSIRSAAEATDMCQEYAAELCGEEELSSDELSDPSLLPPQLEMHVVGGSPVPPRTHYHMALIGYGDLLRRVQWQCGGSIISNNFILCAAHCVENYSRQLARWVKVGDLDVSRTDDDARPEILVISQRIIHPDYKPPDLYNDIALFRLERSLVFNPWVGPACLTTKPVVSESHATVTGWGRTETAGNLSPQLLAVDVSLVPGKKCKRLLGKSSRIPEGINTDTMICAGEKEGGKDACSGDSGGPLVINSTTCLKTQIGIISFGRLCALPNSPGVYTRIYYFLPWIQSLVWP